MPYHGIPDGLDHIMSNLEPDKPAAEPAQHCLDLAKERAIASGQRPRTVRTLAETGETASKPDTALVERMMDPF